jgi:hypothetical protein
MQNIKYKQNLNEYEFIGSYMIIKDQLLPDSTGFLDAYDKDLKMYSALLRYTREYREYDKLELTFGVNKIKELQVYDDSTQYAATLRNFNTFGKFDIFNEVLYYRDDIGKENYYDYSAGVIYHYNDDLSFSIKGTNILDKAKESNYSRLNIQTLKPEKPLKISPIDRKFMMRMEYTF